MKTCEDCGERVYNLGCVNCNELAYIKEQDRLTDLQYPAVQNCPWCGEGTWNGKVCSTCGAKGKEGR